VETGPQKFMPLLYFLNTAQSTQSPKRRIFAQLVTLGATTGAIAAAYQGCQMVYFQTKNSKLGKFWSAFEKKMLVIIWPLGYI
jgi:hypothetical protein